MSARDDGGSAFPSPEIRGYDGTGICAAEYGMSLRDWFAGQAMVGMYLAAAGSGGLRVDDKSLRNDADTFYRMADAMLAARSAGIEPLALPVGGKVMT